MDIDVDNGGVIAAAVFSRPPNPTDPQMKEPQPFTWLRGAPYIVAMLAGVALFAVGAAPDSRSCLAAADEKKPSNATGCDHLGYVLALVGVVLLAIAATLAAVNFECCLPRLDQADD
jgi:hypothetical protein